MATRVSHNPNPVRYSVWHAPSGNVYRVVDLEHGARVLIQPTPRDCARGVQRDPNSCAMAVTWKRQADVPDAMFGAEFVYLPMRQNGELVAYRCKLMADGRRIIDHFDRTGEFPAEGFWVYGIPPSEKMDHKRQVDKRSRERWAEVEDRPKAKPRHVLMLRNAARRAQTEVLEADALAEPKRSPAS